MSPLKINLAGLIPNSISNGPGLRRAFFAQGCKHKCHNCFNPHTWEFGIGKEETVDNLVDDVKYETYLDGVTFTGGDPFFQAEAFAELAQRLSPIFNIWAYTGYIFEELMEIAKKDKNIKTLLENIDVVVDGRFDETKKDHNLLYCGSTNQRLVKSKESMAAGKIILFDLDEIVVDSSI